MRLLRDRRTQALLNLPPQATPALNAAVVSPIGLSLWGVDGPMALRVSATGWLTEHTGVFSGTFP